MKVLVINCGSSSLKYQVLDMTNEQLMCKGLVERIGMDGSVITHEKIGQDKVVNETPMKDHKDAISMVLDAYDELKPDGVLLKIDGECVAFAIGQKIGTDTFDVVFEKADHSVRGAYKMINKMFASYARCVYPEAAYINRENDLDIPGLRQAKESYRPALMLRKYKAQLK